MKQAVGDGKEQQERTRGTEEGREGRDDEIERGREVVRHTETERQAGNLDI